MPPRPLTNFETKNYYENEPRFNGASRDNLPKTIKNGAYVIDLDEYEDVVGLNYLFQFLWCRTCS